MSNNLPTDPEPIGRTLDADDPLDPITAAQIEKFYAGLEQLVAELVAFSIAIDRALAPAFAAIEKYIAARDKLAEPVDPVEPTHPPIK